MNNGISSLVNGASALVIGGYLAAVVYQGNTSKIITEVVKDYGYLEFLIALIVLKVIVDNPGTHDIATLLIVSAIIAAFIKFVENSGLSTDALKEFGAGRAGLFETIGKVFG